ncbi:MAG: hypothetical protein U0414_14890 [Polyangiaceae bacterium]
MARRPNPRRISRRAAIAGSMALAAGCSSNALVPWGGRKVDSAVIDADPILVLPADPVMLAYLDLQAAFRSSLSADVVSLVSTFVPLGPESNFVPTRDAARIYGGVYAMQGLDFAGIMQGNFDLAAIARSADARAAAGGASPLVKTRYADSDIYTISNVGFAALSPQTMLLGNETGIRRGLDRLRKRVITRGIPSWMFAEVGLPGTAFGLVGDFGAESVYDTDADGRFSKRPSAAAAAGTPALDLSSGSFPFLQGAKLLRARGTFSPPGANIVGALTYETEERANVAVGQLANVGNVSPGMSILLSIGVGASIANPTVARAGRDVAFIEPVDERLLRAVLQQLMDRK